MNPSTVDIKDMLEGDSALGLIFATNLFIGREPTAPTDCVTIMDTPGFSPQLTMDSQNYYYSSIQVKLRNNSYIAGMDLAIRIMESLHGRAQETWNGTLYSVITCSQEPGVIAWDSNNNPIIVSNFNIQRR